VRGRRPNVQPQRPQRRQRRRRYSSRGTIHSTKAIDRLRASACRRRPVPGRPRLPATGCRRLRPAMRPSVRGRQSWRVLTIPLGPGDLTALHLNYGQAPPWSAHRRSASANAWCPPGAGGRVAESHGPTPIWPTPHSGVKAHLTRSSCSTWSATCSARSRSVARAPDSRRCGRSSRAGAGQMTTQLRCRVGGSKIQYVGGWPSEARWSAGGAELIRRGLETGRLRAVCHASDGSKGGRLGAQ
jgi:hypothetical protein